MTLYFQVLFALLTFLDDSLNSSSENQKVGQHPYEPKSTNVVVTGNVSWITSGDGTDLSSGVMTPLVGRGGTRDGRGAILLLGI